MPLTDVDAFFIRVKQNKDQRGLFLKLIPIYGGEKEILMWGSK